MAGRDARIVRAAAARKRGSALLQRSPAMSPLCLVQRSGDSYACRALRGGGRISLAAHQSIALNTVQRAHHTWNTLIAYRMRTVRIVWNVLVERLSCCLTTSAWDSTTTRWSCAACSDIRCGLSGRALCLPETIVVHIFNFRAYASGTRALSLDSRTRAAPRYDCASTPNPGCGNRMKVWTARTRLAAPSDRPRRGRALVLVRGSA